MHTSTRGSAATDLSPVHPPQRVDSLRATARQHATSEVDPTGCGLSVFASPQLNALTSPTNPMAGH
jgi:hypothetical protein